VQLKTLNLNRILRNFWHRASWYIILHFTHNSH